MTAAFDGLRVVDLSDRLSGAWAARLFGDMGADVVLAEPPQGHPLRREPPFLSVDASHPRREPESLLHAYANWNKRSCMVESETDTAALAAGADLLVTTAAPPWPDAVQAAVDALPADAIHLSITPHGLEGPLASVPGNNLTACARSGWSFVTRYREEPPLQLPVRQTDYLGGVAGFNAAAAALYRRTRGGGGVRCDVSELEAACATTAPGVLNGLFTGNATLDYGFGGGTLRGEPSELLQAADGLINFGFGEWAKFGEAMHFLGVPDLADDPEYAPLLGRYQTDMARLRLRVADAIAHRQRNELLHGLLTLRCITGAMQTIADLRRDEQLEARTYFVATQIDGREAHAPGAFARMPEMPWQLRRPAPALGEHNGEIAPAPVTPRSIGSRPSAGPPPPERPLQGVRVLAFTQAWAGTWGTEQLALLGADVVQIEVPTRPDVWRGAGRPVPEAIRDPKIHQHRLNTCADYNTVNLNKRSLTLNMTHPRGSEIFWEMLPRFDIVAENFSPHVMPNWGITLESLSAKRPGIIWASVSGYGTTGPFAEYPANGAMTEPMAGLSSIHGYEGDPGSNTGGLIPDPISGYYMAAAMLSALHHRDRTGEAVRIDLAMGEAVAQHLGDAVLEYDANDHIRRPSGNRHPRIAPHNVYEAADGQWLALSAETDAAFAALAESMQQPQLARDPRFLTAALRKHNEIALDEIIAIWCRHQEADQAESDLGDRGVHAARARAMREVFADPHPQFLAREYLQPVTHPESGTHRMPVGPWRIGDAAIPAPSPAPCFGEHSREVLRQELGIDDASQVDGEKTPIGPCQLERPGAVVHRLVPDPGLGPLVGFVGVQPPG